MACSASAIDSVESYMEESDVTHDGSAPASTASEASRGLPPASPPSSHRMVRAARAASSGTSGKICTSRFMMLNRIGSSC